MYATYLPVTLIIPHWNRSEELVRCVTSLSILSYLPERVLIIDDHSDAVEFEVIRQAFTAQVNLQIVRLSHNAGTALAKNVGLFLSQTPYVWFLDSDTEILWADTLKQAISFLDAHQEIGAVGGEIVRDQAGELFLRETKLFPNYWTQLRYHRVESCPEHQADGIKATWKKVQCIPTNNWVSRKKLLIQMGGFCPHLSIGEDKLLCLQLLAEGYSLGYSSRWGVLHKQTSSGRVDNLVHIRNYYADHAFIFGAVSNILWLFPLLNALSWLLDLADAKNRIRNIARFGVGFTVNNQIHKNKTQSGWLQIKRLVKVLALMVGQYLFARKLKRLLEGKRYRISLPCQWGCFCRETLPCLMKDMSP